MWMLLHGFTGSPRSWDTVVSRASLRPASLRPSLFGHGPQWRRVCVDSFEAEAARLAALAKSMETPRFLAGYSLGARVALGMLVANPGLFDGAVLVGVHPGLDDGETRADRRALDAERAHVLRTRGLPAFVASWEEEPMFASQRNLPDLVVERQRQIRLGHDAEGLARALEVLGLAEMPSYEQALRTLRVPITLMAGAHDRKFCDLMHHLASGSCHLVTKAVEGAGHNLLLEAPEAVALAMRDAAHVGSTEAPA